MNIIDYVKQRHRQIKELIRQLELEEREEERGSLRVKLADFLAAHIVAENEVLMPLLMKHLGSSALVFESSEEHTVVAFMLDRLVAIPLSHHTFSARFRVFKDILLNHLEVEGYDLITQLGQVAPEKKLEKAGKEIELVFCNGLREGWEKLVQSLLSAEKAKTKEKTGKKVGKKAVVKKATAKATKKSNS